MTEPVGSRNVAGFFGAACAAVFLLHCSSPTGSATDPPTRAVDPPETAAYVNGQGNSGSFDAAEGISYGLDSPTVSECSTPDCGSSDGGTQQPSDGSAGGDNDGIGPSIRQADGSGLSNVDAGPAGAGCDWVSPYDRKTYHGIHLSTHGGGALSSPKVILDFWGAYYTSGRGYSLAAQFFGDSKTTLKDPQFWPTVASSTSGSVLGGSVQDRFFFQPSVAACLAGGRDGYPCPTALPLSDASIRNHIEQDIANGLPAGQSGNVIDVVFLPPGTCSTNEKGDTCDKPAYGYHRHYYSRSLAQNVIYAVINPSWNTEGWTTALFSHEVMEAATNPDGRGYFSDHPTVQEVARDSDGVPSAAPEIGDLCNWGFASYGPQATQVTGAQIWRQDICRCNTVYKDPRPTECGRIQPGQSLHRGDALDSCNGRFRVALEASGNLVVYNRGIPLWSTKTTNGLVADFGTDGDFVLYDQDYRPIHGIGFYESGPTSRRAPGRLPSLTGSNSGQSLWMREDGNLVIVSSMGSAIWATNTAH